MACVWIRLVTCLWATVSGLPLDKFYITCLGAAVPLAPLWIDFMSQVWGCSPPGLPLDRFYVTSLGVTVTLDPLWINFRLRVWGRSHPAPIWINFRLRVWGPSHPSSTRDKLCQMFGASLWIDTATCLGAAVPMAPLWIDTVTCLGAAVPHGSPLPLSHVWHH